MRGGGAAQKRNLDAEPGEERRSRTAAQRDREHGVRACAEDSRAPSREGMATGQGSGAAGSGGNRSGMPRPARTGPRLRSKKELFIENKFTGTKLAAEGPKQE